MFNCDFCKKTTAPREPMQRLVVQTRKRIYVHGEDESIGSEIVKEVALCPRCVRGE